MNEEREATAEEIDNCLRCGSYRAGCDLAAAKLVRATLAKRDAANKLLAN